MPRGVYSNKKRAKGERHGMWLGGLPQCKDCGMLLSQYRSPSTQKRGVQKRCRQCYLATQMKSKKQYQCKDCGVQISKNAKRCFSCAAIAKRGKSVSPSTQWKVGEMPASHLRDNFGNKYNVSPAHMRTYKNVVYHSKMEADYAAYLDLLINTGEIKEWSSQFAFPIEVKGNLIAKYFCDFKVTKPDGTLEYHEVKGHATELYKLKRQLVELLHGVEIIEIKQKDFKNLGIY